jgi:Zn-finger nucleic acid-binding protein
MGHGLWLDHDDLRQIVRSTAADRTEEEEQQALETQGNLPGSDAPRACPDCAQPMVAMTYAYESGVLIDQCSAHGIWLDGNELDRIEAWYEGTDRLADSEAGAWRGKLDQIAVDQEAMFDAEEMKVIGPISRLLNRVAGATGIEVPGY